MRILFLGDIVGRPGRDGAAKALPSLKEKYQPHIVIANAENIAGGIGITPDLAHEVFEFGVDVITLGNHAWNKREIIPLLDHDPRLLRPANYPPGAPGRGWGTYRVEGANTELTVMTLAGRVFMEPFDDPFRCLDSLLERVTSPCVFIDFHAEATSEKVAFGYYADGKVSAVVGTHTHVQTADERILDGGTAYITDAGMCGPINSVIGMDKEIVLKKFLTGMPARFEVGEGEPLICGVFIELDQNNGKAVKIERIQTYVGK